MASQYALWHEVYRLAVAQAIEAAKPSRLERLLAVSVN
jgi:hypothetical protein